MTQHPLLQVDNLSVDFSFNHQRVHAVRDVGFSLFEQETLGIVGESGCGKSTLAKALVRLTPPTSRLKGSVLYKETDILSLSEKQMQTIRGKEMSMIFQDPMTSLNPTMKIGRQIIEGYLLHHTSLRKKEQHALAIKLLTRVGIPRPSELAGAYPHTLSGGMRQRVMIALSLAAKPNILIADEPTTALDVTIQAQIIELLKEIQRDLKMSIILITHDLSVIAHFCHRVLVMYAGKIVESAPVEQLFSSPKHPYTKRLLASLPRLNRNPRDALQPIHGSPPSLTHTLSGCSFCTRCTHAMKICKQIEPPLLPKSEDHYFACHKERAP